MTRRRSPILDAAIVFAEASVPSERMIPTETQMLPGIIELAQMLGWLVHHCRAAWTSKGYRTPIQGDAGFPDLVMARRGRVVFAEVKSAGKNLDANQVIWRQHIEGNAGAEYYVWQPKHWGSAGGEIAEILR